MKVCTDACVFGALIDPRAATRILDVGTGTGLLALMMAQKSTASIDAVEIDAEAADQARSNAAGSRFAACIRVHLERIQDFMHRDDLGKFDLICCNPPYFENCMRSANPQRRMARHTDSLTFAELALAVSKLLTPNGRFYVHVPIEFEASLMSEIMAHGLAIDQRVAARHAPTTPINRVYLRGGFGPLACIEDGLSFRNDDDSDYSPRVRAMLAPYYASIDPL